MSAPLYGPLMANRPILFILNLQVQFTLSSACVLFRQENYLNNFILCFLNWDFYNFDFYWKIDIAQAPGYSRRMNIWL